MAGAAVWAGDLAGFGGCVAGAAVWAGDLAGLGRVWLVQRSGRFSRVWGVRGWCGELGGGI